MSKSIKIIIVVFIIGVVAFFAVPVSHDVHFKESEQISVLIYSKNGMIDRELTIPPRSKLHKQLNLWLNSNSSGWKHSLDTHRPQILIKAKEVSLNLKNRYAVINYVQWSERRYTQIIRELDNSKFIDELLKKSL